MTIVNDGSSRAKKKTINRCPLFSLLPFHLVLVRFSPHQRRQIVRDAADHVARERKTVVKERERQRSESFFLSSTKEVIFFFLLRPQLDQRPQLLLHARQRLDGLGQRRRTFKPLFPRRHDALEQHPRARELPLASA